jgi:hypothetical protein
VDRTLRQRGAIDPARPCRRPGGMNVRGTAKVKMLKQ